MSAPTPGASARPVPVRPAVLFRAYRRDGDLEAREALIEHFMPLARRLARRYHSGLEPLDDLTQVASLALVDAVDRFDPARGAAFGAYAAATISGALKRHFRDNVWAVHVPRGLKERSLLVRRTEQQVFSEEGRPPSAEDLAQRTGLEPEEVTDAIGSYRALTAESLDAPVGRDGGDVPTTLADVALVGTEAGYALAEERVDLGEALRTLTPRARGILLMRFAEDRTQAEIAQRIGVSQMQVSRILRRIFEHMREVCEVPDDAVLV